MAVITGLKVPSLNEKTGPLAQVYFLRTRDEPTVHQSGCGGVCGRCPWQNGGGCYVQRKNAPLTIYRAWKRGVYRHISELPRDLALRVLKMRYGAFGDPASMHRNEFEYFFDLFPCAEFTGYTHAWAHAEGAHLRRYFLASTTSKDNERALKLGWSTFCCVAPWERKSKRLTCLHETTGVKCFKCMRCRRQSGPPVTTYVTAHGAQWQAIFPRKR